MDWRLNYGCSDHCNNRAIFSFRLSLVSPSSNAQRLEYQKQAVNPMCGIMIPHNVIGFVVGIGVYSGMDEKDRQIFNQMNEKLERIASTIEKQQPSRFDQFITTLAALTAILGIIGIVDIIIKWIVGG